MNLVQISRSVNDFLSGVGIHHYPITSQQTGRRGSGRHGAGQSIPIFTYDDKRDLKEVLSFELWVVSCLGDESRECENDRILPIGCPSRLTRMKKKS
jgi:hypothetical protein